MLQKQCVTTWTRLVMTGWPVVLQKLHVKSSKVQRIWHFLLAVQLFNHCHHPQFPTLEFKRTPLYPSFEQPPFNPLMFPELSLPALPLPLPQHP